MSSVKKENKRKFHFFRYFFIVVALVLIFVVISLPFYLSSQSGKEMILEKVNRNIEGKVVIGGLSIGWFSGVRVEELDFNSDDGLTRVTVEKIITNPSYLSFLGGKVNLGKTTVDKPKVYLKLDSMGESLTEGKSQKRGKESAGAALLAKMDLKVNDGDVTIETDGGKLLRFARLGAKVDLAGVDKRNDFDVSVDVEDQNGTGHGKIKASGNVKGDIKNGQWDFGDTSGNFKVLIDSVDVGQLKPLFKATGSDFDADGIVDVNMDVKIVRGEFDNIEGRIDCRDVNVVLAGSPGDRIRSKEIRADVKVIGTDTAYNVEKLDVVSDWLVINGSGNLGKKPGSKGSFEARFNFDIASAAGSMPRTFSVREGVEITGGNVSGNLLCVTSSESRDFVAKASVEGLAAAADGKSYQLSRPVDFNLDVSQVDEKWKVEKARMSSSFANIDCQGTFDNMEYNVDSDLSVLQDELGSLFDFGGYGFAGKMEQEGVINFVGDMISNKGKTELDNLVITKGNRQAKEPEGVIDFDLSMNKASEVLDIVKLIYSGGSGKLDLSGSSVYLGDNSGDTNLQISADAELEKMMPFAVMAGVVPAEYSFRGKADVDAKVSKKDDMVTLITDGSRIESPELRYGGEVFFDQNYAELDFNGKFNLKSKSISIESMRLVSPQIKIIKGSIIREELGDVEKLKGHFEYDVNLVAVGEIVDPFLPEGFEIFGREQGRLNFDSEYPNDHPELMLDHLNANTKFGFGKASYMGLNFEQTSIDVQIDDGYMKILPFETVVNDGNLAFAAEADFAKRPVVLKMPESMQVLDKVHIDTEMSKKLLKYLNPMFARLTDVRGLLSFYCDRLQLPLDDVNPKNVVVEGTVSMDEVYISGGGFISQLSKISNVHNPNVGIKVLPTKFVFEDGVMHYDDMQINFGDKPVNFTGNVYVDKVMSMTVTLPWKLREAGSRVKLPVSGPVTEPKIETDEMIRETGRQLIEEQLDKAFKDLFNK